MEHLFIPNDPTGFTWLGLILSAFITILIFLISGYIENRNSKTEKKESHK